MCGIAGGLHLPKDQLALMLDALAHRGPDGRGDFRAGDFCVGMTRLAILDLEAGKQPFVSECGRVKVVCNGEIYNWRELRDILEQAGHQFKTQCDCEIIPAAWMEWGLGMLTRFNGMFALALYDKDSGNLFLARDRCGQKPLYLTTEGPFRFASEIKALSEAGTPLIPDPQHLSNWLALRYTPQPHTLLKNIQTLPAGHWLRVNDDGTIHSERYWQPSPAVDPEFTGKDNTSLENSIDQLDALSRRSVELALQADVPVAAYLSAGVDSSLLAHYIRESGTALETVSIGFGSQSDETGYATALARKLGFNHHPIQLCPSALEDLPRVIRQMDLPLGDALILAFDKLAAHTAQLGCKVALGGEGPDEHFAGYSFHQSYLRAARMSKASRAITSSIVAMSPLVLLDRISQFPAGLGPQGRAKVCRYLRNFSSLCAEEQTIFLRTLFESSESSTLLHPDILSKQTKPEHSRAYPASEDRLNFALSSQYQSWLPDWSLIRQDKNTMAHSVEYRAPFLDHHIIDFAFSLPDDYKIRRRQNKFIWRQLAQRHLPAEVTQRPKQPFYLPLEDPAWRDPLIAMAHEHLSPSGYSCNGWLRPEAVTPLLSAKHFLPLKQLAAILILQLWLDSLS